MRINEVIHNKGSSVITARADQDVRHLVDLLAEHRIGAVVITDDGDTVTGIVGERDVVQGLRRFGPDLLDRPISDVMDSDVHTCGMDDELAAVATDMTRFRARHLPVMVDGHLAAIVSIGDIVKSRIDQLQTEQEHLVKYLHG
ncbi:CBS domain-containing protein [Tessaracoccus sp. MC1756]|uniref:CBS domain-containing protein n=1 Tax=Tessaracoccus sp. MC1756 TaxID=2760311 RepID=UPI001602D952|nr:CBS domain-containing protein [Tessaracoccus sp. MC1756]MBB1509562.1 CBS domain-containing protein [Tessaracoccus sp. MC1756]